MSHLIDMSNGRANIAFVGERPWHDLGVEMTPEQTIEEWIAAAGLGYKVLKAPAFALINGEYVGFKNRSALYRDDTNRVLGSGSDSHYKTVQPAEIVEFFRELVEDAGMKLEVAGALKGGARVWALARSGHEMNVSVNKAVQDIIRPYLLLSTCYDGARGTIAQFTNTRVVCNNTIQMAYQEFNADREAGKTTQYVSIPHSQTFNAARVREQLLLVDKAGEQFVEAAQRMAQTGVGAEQCKAFIAGLFSKVDKAKEVTAQSEKVMAEVLACVDNSPGAELATARGTAWGLLNGVTNFVDFKMRARTSDNRLNSAWFGDGARIKTRAFDAALALAA